MLKLIEHKGEKRIAFVSLPKKYSTNDIRKIPNRRWSQTKRLWHIPANRESLEYLKNHFNDLYNDFVKSNKKTGDEQAKKDVKIFVDDEYLHIIIDWDKQDIEFLKKFDKYKYDSNIKMWSIKKSDTNNEKIKQYFKNRIKIIDELPKKVKNIKSSKNELQIVEYKKGRIKIIYKYDKNLVKLIKQFPYSIWDAENKWWTCVNSINVIKDLEEYCKNQKIEIKFINNSERNIRARALKESIANYRECPAKYIEKLELLRYSKNTIKTYKSHFEEFINFYNTKKINEINELEIIEFTRFLVAERKVSASYQNITINAIKFYYEKVLGETRKFYHITRPKKEKVLPVVLSKDEVMRMIKVTKNLKHKTIIVLIYSAGLRVSEAINLKIEDIDSKRKLIKINQSKGKKDRNSLLSDKTLLLLREYYKLYKPRKYIFEGRYNEKYTSSSIQKIMKVAAKNAGIVKKVTAHTLRHSFATHLLEQGVNLRYIQNILGHESSKTTEIYTHVSNNSISEIKNPLDDMVF